MRYAKQFHNWPSIYLLPLLFGGACLGMIFVWDDPSTQMGMLVCAVFAWIAAWTLRKARDHWLEINREWIVHHGSSHWEIRKTDIVRVECGKKGWVEDCAPYLKVHTIDREYQVDSGFLINEKRIEELVRAMRNGGGVFCS